jgi:amidohydrolase
VTNLQPVRTAIEHALLAELPAAVALRHELHAHPERSGQEQQTAARVAEALGDPDAPTVAGTGRLVRVGTNELPAVAVRAELDGLPIRERTGAEFAATGEIMHACGHDVHLAGIVALARAIRRVDPPAGLVAVLQPREETRPSGAQDLVESGALNDHHVSAVVGVHVQPQLPRGTFAADPGVVNAASDEFELVITGAGGHGGYPHLTHDPVPALCQCVATLQEMLRQSVNPTHPAVLTVGMLRAGEAANVIPDTARARGTLRTFDPEDRKFLIDRISTSAAGIAAAYGCSGAVELHEVDPPLANDPRLARLTADWLARAGFKTQNEFRSCGSDDFAYYCRVAPSVMIFIGTGSANDAAMLHEPRFLPADDLVHDVARAALAGYLAAVDHRTNPPAPARP